MTIATPCGPRRLSRAARIIVVGSALAAGCRDAPTAPNSLPGQTASLDLQSSSLGIPASELPPSAVVAAIAETSTIPMITGISFGGQPQQVAVLTTPDGGFPADGESYLVVSSGDARSPRDDGAWTWISNPPLERCWPLLCSPPTGIGDEAWVAIDIALPSNAVWLHVRVNYFSADDVVWLGETPGVAVFDFARVFLWPWSLEGMLASPVHLAKCGPPMTPVRCSGGFSWFSPEGMVWSIDVRSRAGQTVTLVADARDLGWHNQLQTGVAIDGLGVILANLGPVANAGGPYFVDEGATLVLDARASSDPEGGALTYAWDLDGDGAFDDAVGSTVSRSYADDGSYPVGLRVTDPQGATGINTTTVTVHNVAPMVFATGPTVVHPQLGHASVSIRVEFSDPGADTHSATIDCDNGGSPVQLGIVTSPFSQECSFTTSAFGPRTIRVTVTDDDDGSAAVTHAVAILYPWTGFFSPVETAPVENRANAGSAIPLKFGLGGNQGLDVLAAGSPTSRPASCGGYVLDGPIEASTPGASQLTYSGASGLYHYVWKTEKAWAGTCRQLDVRLADGTVHSAHFRFK